jgi:hypothetical protein
MDLLLEAFSEKMVEIYIEKSIKIIRSKIVESYFDEYEEVLYSYKKNKLLLYADDTEFKLVFVPEKSHLIIAKFSFNDDLEKIKNEILDIYLSITHENKSLDYCIKCIQPYYNNYKPGDYLDKYCNNCEVFQMLKIRKFMFEKLECNICYVKNLEQNTNNKIIYKKMHSITCCKDKIVCKNCIEYLEGNCSKTKCPFCRQELCYEKI